MTAVPMDAVEPPRDWSHLTARERRIMAMVDANRPRAEIAAALAVSKSSAFRLIRIARERLGVWKKPTTTRLDVLSPAQRSVWDLAEQGIEAPEIARILGMKVHAVHNFRSQARLRMARKDGLPPPGNERIRRIDAQLKSTPRCGDCLLRHEPGPCESPLRLNPWQRLKSVFE
jgi:DNA-binding CsgD family transcriptional regulator